MTKQTECILEFDESRYPIVYVTHRGQMTTDAMERSVLAYKRQLGRKRPFTLIFDARTALKPPGEALKILDDFMKSHHEVFGLYCAGIAYALDSVLLRMVTRGIFLVTKPPFPWIIFASPDEAEHWCRERLSNFNPHVS